MKITLQHLQQVHEIRRAFIEEIAKRGETDGGLALYALMDIALDTAFIMCKRDKAATLEMLSKLINVIIERK